MAVDRGETPRVSSRPPHGIVALEVTGGPPRAVSEHRACCCCMQQQQQQQQQQQEPAAAFDPAAMSFAVHTAEARRALSPQAIPRHPAATDAAASPAAAAAAAAAAAGENEWGEDSEDELCLPAYRHPRGTPKKRPWGAPAFKPRFKEAWDPTLGFGVGTPRFQAKDTDVHDAGVSPISLWFEGLADAAGTAADDSRAVHPIRPPAVPLPPWPPPDQTFAAAAAAEATTAAPAAAAAKRQQQLRHASTAAAQYPLEPLHALDEEVFLRGPPEGRGPLTRKERLHLREVGLDFNEKAWADGRRVFGGEEKERWRRSKVLRARLKNKEVVFRRDVLAAEFEADFVKYTGRPYRARASSGIGSQKGCMQPNDGAEAYRASLPWSYYFEKEAETDKQQQPREEPPPKQPELPIEMLADDRRLELVLETEALRIYEAATGVLPSAFAGLVKTRHVSAAAAATAAAVTATTAAAIATAAVAATAAAAIAAAAAFIAAAATATTAAAIAAAAAAAAKAKLCCSYLMLLASVAAAVVGAAVLPVRPLRLWLPSPLPPVINADAAAAAAAVAVVVVVWSQEAKTS
ncbi:hypothetical protein Emed_001131 [Eimeria media]